MWKWKYVITILILFLCSCTSKEKDADELNTESIETNSALFLNIDQIKINSNFTREDTIEQGQLKSYTIVGNYDFDGNGIEDTVNLILKFRGASSEKSVFQINKSTFVYEFFFPYELYIVDLDTQDKYVEFAIYDDGPSGDPSFTFFRYTGKDILLLGNINGYPSFDSKGHFITSVTDFVTPRLIFETGEIIDNNMDFRAYDYSKYMNTDLKVAYDFDAYFVEYDSIPDDFMPSYDREVSSFVKGNIIQIEHIEFLGNIPFWYQVKLDNGTKGILYFWLGD